MHCTKVWVVFEIPLRITNDAFPVRSMEPPIQYKRMCRQPMLIYINSKRENAFDLTMKEHLVHQQLSIFLFCT
jgi:hypothetical protein